MIESLDQREERLDEAPPFEHNKTPQEPAKGGISHSNFSIRSFPEPRYLPARNEMNIKEKGKIKNV